ncbi:hypothetical protein INT44_003386 [Umbelopsis vinacea]|uniref:Uncharacterized protein n=1 Tax=Umbelopsis vinacea TaxID=44442 RepID=A0A8H7UIK3_9FUNG|nr:hypothetical protein INT44_003386 [Umbelopsis vinacea]
MDVLMPKGFSIDSIEKCMMDYDSNFIEYNDEEAINSRLGSSFIVLKQTHFIAYYDQQQTIHGSEKVSFSRELTVFFVAKIRLICSSQTNVLGSEAEDGSIIANYTTVDIPSFAEITKSKQCNDKFFIVNLGDDQHLCCNIQTLKTFTYHSCARFFVLDVISGGTEEGFTRLHDESEKVKSLKPLPKDPNFTLLDIEGNPVEEQTEYQLEMYDQDMDILNFFDDKLSGTAFENQVEILAVKFSIVDGIHHLTYDNKYLHVADGNDEISLTDQLPRKHQRLQFVLTEHNTFIIFKWNQRVCLEIETFTNSYSALSFVEEKLSDRGSYLQLFFLKRV